MSIAIPLHLLATVVWVGGMFFTYMVLRPVAASLLEPPLGLSLWAQVFDKFFFWVWVAIIILLATGLWMVYSVFGGFGNVGLYVQAANDLPEAGRRLAQVRFIIGICLMLGLLVIVIASAGRFM
jgi:uncharacterized membrane protein